MKACLGVNCLKREQCLYYHDFNAEGDVCTVRDFSLMYADKCPNFYPWCYENKNFNEQKGMKNTSVSQDKCSQHMEIALEDFSFVAEALMKVGYQVLSYQDGESMDIVQIDYIHPKYEGKIFKETES